MTYLRGYTNVSQKDGHQDELRMIVDERCDSGKRPETTLKGCGQTWLSVLHLTLPGRPPLGNASTAGCERRFRGRGVIKSCGYPAPTSANDQLLRRRRVGPLGAAFTSPLACPHHREFIDVPICWFTRLTNIRKQRRLYSLT